MEDAPVSPTAAAGRLFALKYQECLPHDEPSQLWNYALISLRLQCSWNYNLQLREREMRGNLSKRLVELYGYN